VRSPNGTGNRLGMLCDQLARHETMATDIEEADAGAHLSELLALVTGGAPFDERRVDELLDLVEDACAVRGLAPLGVREHKDARLPYGFGLPPGEAEAEVKAWVCPWDRCGRVVLPEEAAPRCAAGDTSMRPFPPRR
jgi:hypothetical protein